MKKLVSFVVAGIVLSLGVAALALGASGKGGHSLSATLTSKADKAKGAPNAKGSFTGTISGHTLKWTLKFSGLSGQAMQAHIHQGKAGVSGNVIVPLCTPCKSGQHGTIALKSDVADMIERSGSTYVNVHTAKNPAGEIRGQLKSTDS